MIQLRQASTHPFEHGAEVSSYVKNVARVLCSTRATHIDSFIHRLLYSIQQRSATQLIDFVGTGTTHSNKRPKIPRQTRERTELPVSCNELLRYIALWQDANSKAQRITDFKRVLIYFTSFIGLDIHVRKIPIYCYVGFKTFGAMFPFSRTITVIIIIINFQLQSGVVSERSAMCAEDIPGRMIK
jgi:hypothetical protein